jgi:hypothetical protein
MTNEETTKYKEFLESELKKIQEKKKWKRKVKKLRSNN